MTKTIHPETGVDVPSVSDLSESIRFQIEDVFSQSEVRERLESANPEEVADTVELTDTTKQSLQKAQQALLETLSPDQRPPQIQIKHLVRGIGLIRDHCMVTIEKSPNTEQYLLFTSEGVPVIHENNGDFPFIPDSDTIEVLLQARHPSLAPRKNFEFEIIGL